MAVPAWEAEGIGVEDPPTLTEADECEWSEQGSELSENEFEDVEYQQSSDQAMRDPSLIDAADAAQSALSAEQRNEFLRYKTLANTILNGGETSDDIWESRCEQVWNLGMEMAGNCEALFHALCTWVGAWQATHLPVDEPDPSTMRRDLGAAADEPAPTIRVYTYEEALGCLPSRFGERQLLLCFGNTLEEVRVTLTAMDVPYTARTTLLAHWTRRRAEVQSDMDLRIQPVFITTAQLPPLPTTSPTSSEPPTKKPRVIPRKPYTRLNIPSTRTGVESAADRDKVDYKDCLHHIIRETQAVCNELHYPCFPLAAAEASVEDIAHIYGQAITAKAGGGRVMLQGLKQRWSRIRRLFDALREAGGQLTVNLVCTFIDASRYKGVHALLRWAGNAFGLPDFVHMSEHAVIKNRMPSAVWEATGADRVNEDKHAAWVPDEFIMYLADMCHHPNPIIRRKACYLYSCAVGGVRYADSQHVVALMGVNVNLPGALIDFTASRFKATKGTTTEHFAIPIYDYKGRSVLQAALDLKEQMGEGYLLAAAENSRALGSETSYPRRGSSYSQTTEMLRAFVDDWQKQLPEGHIHKDVASYRSATIHSFKGWLDTLAKQALFSEDDIETLLHWSSTKMHRRYDRNPIVKEVFLRQKVVALMNTTWRSAGYGHQMTIAPPLSELLPVTPQTFQF